MRQSTHSRAVHSAFSLIARGIRMIAGVGTVLCIIALVAVYVFSATNTARLVPVMSNSMAPDMPVGALAVTVPVARTDIAVDDVIVFTDPDHPTIRVIHRVVHVFGPDEAAKFSNWDPDLLVASTKGDNNPTADPWTLTVADATIWRLDRSFPYLGQPAIWFETPSIRFWGFGAAGIFLVSWLLVLVWRRPTPEQVEE
jgi:signal peptidase